MRKDGWLKQPTILSITVRGTGVTPEHQISKSEDKREDGWLNQPTTPRIMQDAGVTPEHQISKSEDKRKDGRLNQPTTSC